MLYERHSLLLGERFLKIVRKSGRKNRIGDMVGLKLGLGLGLV